MRVLRAIASILFGAAPALASPAEKTPMIEQVDYAGWKTSYHINNGLVELYATADIGPRIVDYRPVGGENVFYLRSSELGRSGEQDWVFRGGWRLWIAPEERETTYVPDNRACEASVLEGQRLLLVGPPQPAAGIQKSVEISLVPGQPRALVVSRLRNIGTKPVTYASWSLSVMRPGGRAFVPLDRGNPTTFSDVRRLILWSYTKQRDPRYVFGDALVQVDHTKVAAAPASTTPGRQPDESKIGVDSAQGWAAYLNGDVLYLKRFSHLAGGQYPDGGSTIEIYSSAEFLELENLGTMATLKPGADVVYAEEWWLHTGVKLDTDEATALQQLQPFLHASTAAR